MVPTATARPRTPVDRAALVAEGGQARWPERAEEGELRELQPCGSVHTLVEEDFRVLHVVQCVHQPQVGPEIGPTWVLYRSASLQLDDHELHDDERHGGQQIAINDLVAERPEALRAPWGSNSGSPGPVSGSRERGAGCGKVDYQLVAQPAPRLELPQQFLNCFWASQIEAAGGHVLWLRNLDTKPAHSRRERRLSAREDLDEEQSALRNWQRAGLAGLRKPCQRGQATP